MAVVTRFAPSPTGFLHIGGARTALFNWLFARHHAGTFLLRIEDTDRQRSTQAAVDAILDGLRWLGLDWDGEAVSQAARADRHVAAVERLLAEGKAYRCWATPAELAEMRERAKADGRSLLYDGRWRDRDPAEAPAGIDPVIRLRAPRAGVTTVDDRVQGPVTVANDQMDDMVLLRADGTPTYMLAVVVDDHDMEITHVIRGDDHFTNTFRQIQLYAAFGWPLPEFAHVPLLHGADGAKLSKRHGALGVGDYRDQGFLPEAMVNYLLRLGWSHGDDEIISRDQAIAWFDLGGVGRAPARFDLARLQSLNGHYIREADDARLAALVCARLAGRIAGGLTDAARARITAGMPGLKPRARTLEELADKAAFYATPRPIVPDAKAAKLLANGARGVLADLTGALADLKQWSAEALESRVRDLVAAHADDGLDLKAVAQPLRAALTGSTTSPPIFEVMEVLGREETLKRLADALGNAPGGTF